MISIQELGLSIMSENPKPLYILGGQEYGIKDQYIGILIKHFGHKEEYPTVSAVIDFLGVKHLVPVPPTVYIVRYDETFVSSMSDALAKKLKGLKVNGTIVCIYSDNKAITKIDKYLPDNTASIDPVAERYVEKYLHRDFPKLDDRSIKVAAACASNYGHARTICLSMSNADINKLARMSDGQLYHLFGCSNSSGERDIQMAIANRNFVHATKLLDAYEGNLDNIVYTVLQTMIDMEKILTSKYSDSPLKDCAKMWKLEDVYNMFMNAYNELDKLRSNTSTDVKSSLIYLFGLFTFKTVPSLEVMQSDS